MTIQQTASIQYNHAKPILDQDHKDDINIASVLCICDYLLSRVEANNMAPT